MLMVFIGPPGAGKGTQAQRLTEYLQVPHVSTGDLLRFAIQSGSPLGKLVAPYMVDGGLVPDPLVMDVVGERLSQDDCQAGCLFDGFPRTVHQAEALDDFLARSGSSLDLVLELQAPDEEVQRRIAERARAALKAGKPPRDDDQPEKVAYRLRVFRQQTEPVIEYYRRRGVLESISGLGTLDEVFSRIRACIDRRRPKKA